MIYVDLDDVIGESSQMFLRVLEQTFGRKVKYEQLVGFDLATSCGLNEKEYTEFFKRIHLDAHLLQVEPVLGAAETLREWTAEGYKIAIVTGRPQGTRKATEEWLARHGFAHESLIMVDKYTRRSKAPANIAGLDSLATHAFSVAVEDSIEVACHLAKFMGLRIALLDRPWNREDPRCESIIRCHSWKQISGVVLRSL